MAPDLTVCVATHRRPLRLRWLLNALEEQSLARECFEVVVCHSGDAASAALLRDHVVGARAVTVGLEEAGPSRQRNLAWREAAAPVVVFTDDDCRPPPGWLAAALTAARAHPEAVVQGRTLPDPEEAAAQRAPHFHTQNIASPPTPNAQTCNILYPRTVLERLGGFDETLHAGEDTDLAARARTAGVAIEGAPEMLTYHAVQEMSLLAFMRWSQRWSDIPEVVGRHPELRASFPLGHFWSWRHVWLPVAAAGFSLARRRPLAGFLLAFPWMASTFPSRGPDPRGIVRSLLGLPARLAIDTAESVAIARGALRSGTPML